MSEFKVNSKDYGFKPKVVGTDGGDFIITWLHTEESSERQFLASRYNNNGQIIDSEFKISNSTKYGWPENHIAALKDGSNGFVVTYDNWLKKYDATNNMVYSLSEIPPYNDFPLNDQSVISGLYNGDFVFISSDNYDFFYFLISNDLDTKHKVEMNNGDIADRISIDTLKNGNFVMSWLDKSSLYFQCYSNSANPMTEQLIATTNVDEELPTTIAALSDGGFIVAWTAPMFAELYAKKYNQDFSLGCAEFEIPNPTSSIIDRQGYNPSIAGLDNDQFVVTWMNSGNYYAKIYKNDCTIVIDQFKINSEASKSIAHPDYSIPSVSALNNENYVVTWPNVKPSAYEPGSSDKESDVYAKILNVPHCNIVANNQALTMLQYISAKLSLEVYGDGGVLPSGGQR